MERFPRRRSEALADGVFAIVMTLLVLQLRLPVVSGPAPRASLPLALIEMWPEYASYLVSFLFLSLWWLLNTSMLRNLKDMDGPLVWLHLLFLMFVSLIPFSTSLSARYWGQPITGAVYGLNLMAPMIASLAFTSHAARTAGLVEVQVDPGLAKRERDAGIAISVVLLAGVFLSLANAPASFLIYGALGVSYVATIWRGREGLSATPGGPRGSRGG
jgi:uncharacterized membrane protein